ncbi:MAG: thioredoxin family protein [Chitinophagaceae bacterium]|nr:thioredoxin family protein [Chitinophagaceae bacterium]MCB0739494.1 thioredoxin family protein [Chitinophagaceae bacterium]HQU57027.1 thioredoxin family protein [Chitinophagaceae bacterium]HQV05212.1 thioredoxin family protein [Chitinophagaceae bacterium]
MKKTLFLFLLAVSFATFSKAQPPKAMEDVQYQTLIERPNEKSLKGIISKQVLLSDSSFTWYAENLKDYTPYPKAVAALRKHGNAISFIVFMGTWCEDSHNIIPKFYQLLETGGFPETKVTLIGVDRHKTTLQHLAAAMDIKNVPTIIVMQDGKEMGRVVEFGKYGLFDIELAEIIDAIQT